MSYREKLLPAKAAGVIFKVVPEGAVLFSTESEVYFGLNAVGARVWELLPPARNTLEEIVADLAREYPDVSPDTIRDDVAELLAELAELGLVLPVGPEHLNAESVTRRSAQAGPVESGRVA